MGEDLQTAGTEANEDLTPEFTIDELMDEIYQEFHTPPLGPGEFTTSMFAARRNLSDQEARTIIDRALAEGRIEEVGDRRTNHRRATAYRVKCGA